MNQYCHVVSRESVFDIFQQQLAASSELDADLLGTDSASEHTES